MSLKKLWHRAVNRAYDDSYELARVGKHNPDASTTLAVVGRADYLWVTLADQTTVQARNDAGVPQTIDLEVWVRAETNVGGGAPTYVIEGRSAAGLLSAPTTTPPSGVLVHATTHQHGGSDEIATATPAANAIPKADGSGLLDAWVTPPPDTFTDLTDTPAAYTGAAGQVVKVNVGETALEFAAEAGDVAASINAAAEKVTLADDDRVAGTDSEATLALTWWKWSTIKSQLVATFLTFTNKIAIAATATSGAALRVVRDLAAASTDSPVVTIHQDNAGDDQAALDVTQDGTGDVVIFKDGATTVLRVADGGRLDVAQIIRALTASGLRMEDDAGNLGLAIFDGGLVAVGSGIPTSQVHIISEATASSRGLLISQHTGNAAAAVMVFAKSRGTNGTPTVISNGDYGGAFAQRFHDGTGYIQTAAIVFRSNGTVATNSIPTDILFATGAADDPNITNERMRITSAGKVIIGLTSAGASILGIKAGTSSNDAAVGGVLYKETTQRANSGTGETNLGSYAVPANTLAANNQHVEVVFRGTVANNANTKTLKFYFGASSWTLLSTSGANFRWIVRAEIYRTGAATQKVFIHLNRSDVAGDTMTYATATETLSGAVTLKLTGQGGASNDVLEELMTVQWGDANT